MKRVGHGSGRPQAEPAGRLGRHRGVEGDLVQQDGLDQLGLGDRRGHLQQRLARKHDPPLRDCPHLAGEAQPAERVERRLVEAEGVPEPGKLVLVEAKALKERQAVLQACGHQEPRWAEARGQTA